MIERSEVKSPEEKARRELEETIEYVLDWCDNEDANTSNMREVAEFAKKALAQPTITEEDAKMKCLQESLEYTNNGGQHPQIFMFGFQIGFKAALAKMKGDEK